jgi:hypothetical protein
LNVQQQPSLHGQASQSHGRRGAIAAGAASSSALIGFGLDSFVEVSSAAVIIWQFRSRVPESKERLTLRLIAVGC